MSDLISRSAQIDKFSAEAKRIAKNDKDFAQALMYVVTCLDAAPAVDAVEVGNCKGCRWEQRKRPQKCSCCRRNADMKDGYTPLEG